MTALRRLGLLAPLAAFSLAGCGLNSVPTAEENVNAKWGQVQAEYQRRADLIPNLVETVKGYAAHERQVFENVTQARANAINAQGPAQQAEAENVLSGALKSLFAVAEAYPDLKANTNFLELQRELTGTENQIASQRQGYNALVARYNTTLQSFPMNFMAGPFGFTAMPFLEIQDPVQRDAPVVKF